MAHTPFGYRIEQGKAILDEEKASAFRRMLENYLGGMSLADSAADAGIKATHTQVKRMMQNKKYLGTEFYPALMTKEEMDKVSEELLRRAGALGRIREPKEKEATAPIPVEFSMPRTAVKNPDPYEQAQYLYSLIEEAKTDG